MVSLAAVSAGNLYWNANSVAFFVLLYCMLWTHFRTNRESLVYISRINRGRATPAFSSIQVKPSASKWAGISGLIR